MYTALQKDICNNCKTLMKVFFFYNDKTFKIKYFFYEKFRFTLKKVSLIHGSYFFNCKLNLL